jgi:hypothetical protein
MSVSSDKATAMAREKATAMAREKATADMPWPLLTGRTKERQGDDQPLLFSWGATGDPFYAPARELAVLAHLCRKLVLLVQLFNSHRLDGPPSLARWALALASRDQGQRSGDERSDKHDAKYNVENGHTLPLAAAVRQAPIQHNAPMISRFWENHQCG